MMRIEVKEGYPIIRAPSAEYPLFKRRLVMIGERTSWQVSPGKSGERGVFEYDLIRPSCISFLRMDDRCVNLG
jgi:hypothetical protein